MSELNLNEPTDLSKISKADLKKDDIDDDFDDDDAIPAHIREARLNELKMRARELQQAQIYKSDSYKEISEEEFLQLTTKSKKCIIHFFHPDFRRCDIMHTHLQQLVAKYPEVKFAKINVEKAKFFVAKLNIQILPAVLCFLDGVLKHRLIGFDQFGNNDSFPTRLLEKHLWKLKFLKKPDNEEESDEEEDESEKHGPRRTILNSKANQNTNDSDSD